jgi:hypothetical protein
MLVFKVISAILFVIVTSVVTVLYGPGALFAMFIIGLIIALIASKKTMHNEHEDWAHILRESKKRNAKHTVKLVHEHKKQAGHKETVHKHDHRPSHVVAVGSAVYGVGKVSHSGLGGDSFSGSVSMSGGAGGTTWGSGAGVPSMPPPPPAKKKKRAIHKK